MIDQKQVDRVANAVLAAREPIERHVDGIPAQWAEGDHLLNVATGESFYIRFIDRERDVVGVDPPILRG